MRSHNLTKLRMVDTQRKKRNHPKCKISLQNTPPQLDTHQQRYYESHDTTFLAKTGS